MFLNCIQQKYKNSVLEQSEIVLKEKCIFMVIEFTIDFNNEGP